MLKLLHVSILVLVDQSLGGLQICSWQRLISVVSILVLVDQSLGAR